MFCLSVLACCCVLLAVWLFLNIFPANSTFEEARTRCSFSSSLLHVFGLLTIGIDVLLLRKAVRGKKRYLDTMKLEGSEMRA